MTAVLALSIMMPNSFAAQRSHGSKIPTGPIPNPIGFVIRDELVQFLKYGTPDGNAVAECRSLNGSRIMTLTDDGHVRIGGTYRGRRTGSNTEMCREILDLDDGRSLCLNVENQLVEANSIPVGTCNLPRRARSADARRLLVAKSMVPMVSYGAHYVARYERGELVDYLPIAVTDVGILGVAYLSSQKITETGGDLTHLYWNCWLKNVEIKLAQVKSGYAFAWRGYAAIVEASAPSAWSYLAHFETEIEREAFISDVEKSLSEWYGKYYDVTMYPGCPGPLSKPSNLRNTHVETGKKSRNPWLEQSRQRRMQGVVLADRSVRVRGSVSQTTVLSAENGTPVGTQPRGALGRAVSQRGREWLVDFESGPDGLVNAAHVAPIGGPTNSRF